MKYKIGLVAILLAMTSLVHPEGGDKPAAGLKKSDGTPSLTKFNINNVSTYIRNDGESDLNEDGNSGFVFPKGSNKAVFFQSGFVWGAKVDGAVRVGGSAYRQGLQPGRITNSGRNWDQLTAENPSADNVRIFRVRPDYKNADLSAEAKDEGVSAEAVRAQYAKDWSEWPAAAGAPYTDVNKNGQYDPSVDIAGFPGADQTIWFVSNDLDNGKTTFMYGSNPMGIEAQTTVWGYNVQGPLSNMLFRKYTIINKSDKTFEDMYVSMWSDPDLGDASDDYAGCDTTLSLGYIYNGTAIDATYGKYVPAAGFDFFQGPIVKGSPTDEAIFNNKKIQGYKNLPMSAFYFFINSHQIYTDPEQGIYQGTTEFYNLFEGKVSTTGEPFIDPTTKQPTKLTLSGDPLTQNGWVDGKFEGPGDRRIGLVAGPFDMAPGDTQEVVVAQIAAGAFEPVDRLLAVGLLKFYDKTAQAAYDNFFQIIVPPAAPVVNAIPMDRSVILNWGDNMDRVNETESFKIGDYEFEGYNVYQLPNASASVAESRLIATFDLVNGITKIIEPDFDAVSGAILDKVKQFGTDSGIKRELLIKNDVFNSGLPLNNGSKYYFAVTAYSAYTGNDPQIVERTKENPLSVIEVVPESVNPGVRFSNQYGDLIPVSKTAGNSDAMPVIRVVDPTKDNGHTYKITFDVTAGVTSWTLIDVTASDTLVKNSTEFATDDSAPIINGLQVFVSNTAPEIKGQGSGMVEVLYAGNPVNPDAAGAPYGGNKVWHSLNSNNTYYMSAGGGSGDLDRLYRYITAAVPRDFELRFKDTPSYGIYALTDDMIAEAPFEIWDIGINTPDDPSDDRQMIPFFVEEVATSANWGYATGVDPYFGYASSDWIYWMDPESDTLGYTQFAATCDASGGKGAIYDRSQDVSTYGYYTDMSKGIVYPIGRLTVGDFAESGTPPPAGTVVRILTTKPLTSADEYTFVGQTSTYDKEAAKADVDKINVFPNPYYGVNPQEINKYQRFVTFNHLPKKATIRIFNLAGQLVRTINKNTNSQFERWDLNNQDGLPVASGVYIVYVDMPDLGKTKILKSAVIQEQQILDRY